MASRVPGYTSDAERKRKEEEEKRKASQPSFAHSGAQIAKNVLNQYQGSIGSRTPSQTQAAGGGAKQTAPQKTTAEDVGKPRYFEGYDLGLKYNDWQRGGKHLLEMDPTNRKLYVYNSITQGSGKASDAKIVDEARYNRWMTQNIQAPQNSILPPNVAYQLLDDKEDKSKPLQRPNTNAVQGIMSRNYAKQEVNANWNKDWLTLDEERKEAEKQKKQADDYMAQFDVPIQEARSGITNQRQLQNNTVAPFDERPDDYNDYAENYDRILYDWGVGEKGAYDKIGRIGSRDEILARGEKVKELWGDIENESNRRYNEARRNLQEHKAEYDIAKSQSEYYGSQLEAIGNRERQRDEYYGLIDQYDDNLTQTDFVPEYDRGHDNAYGSLGELDRGVVTDDVDRIYSLIGGGKEWQSWNRTGKNQISPEYSYALMMTDGSNGSFNEKGIFMNLYNQAMKEGREPVEAKAFLEGLQPALRARYSGYESVRIQEASKQMPILTSAASLAMGLTNTYLDIPRHIAHLLGDKSTEDPNSWWYATTRQAQQIQDTVSENLGGIAGKAYLSFMNSASNLARGLTTAGAGGKVVQSIMGLGGFFLSVDQEATGRYLKDGYKYDQAQKMGAVDGMFEVAEEFLPFETMLGTEGAKFITSWVLNGLSEFGQEFTGGVLFDEIKATLTGQNDRNDRVNEIIVNGSYTDRDGNQVVLSDDPATAMQQARLQAGKEQFFNALEGGIGGFFGGGLAGFYGTANQAINDVYTGASINNETNVSDGKKAIESLIEVGKNTKDEGVQKLAEKVEGQYKGKGKAGDYLTGKLFRAVADATGAEGQKTVKGTAWRFIRDDLTGKGVNREAAGEYADIVAKGLLGEKLTNEDKKTLARDQLAIDTWKRFNTATKDAVEILNEVNQATKENRSVMDTLGEIAGTKPTAGGAMGAELETSLQKTGGDMERALDDMFSRRSDLLSERYVGAVKESMADKTSPKNKSFLKDAMQIRAAAMTLGAMPKTSMDEATAKKLYDEARAEFDEIDQKRVLKQKTVEPGKGTASFGDAEYGTENWTQKLAGYSKRIRNQAGALAEVAKRAGLSLTFIDDARVDAKTGRDNAKINGFENQDGSIVINLAATEKFGKHMLTTMAHEMTHWLEQNSREGYDSLRQFVLGSLRSRGVNVEQLAVNTIDNQNAVLKGGDGLDFNGAMAEIVAKSCEELLSSRSFQQELAQTDPGTFDKVKTFVKDFVARINAALKDMANYYGSLSWEARQLRDYTEEIGNLWIGARREALGRNAEEGAEAGEGTRFSTAQETAAEERDAKRLKLETPEMLRYSMVGAAAGGSYAERIREAEALSRQGVDAEEIYQQTGAREGFNGKWWVTLDNQNIRMRDGIMEKHRSGKKFRLTEVMDAPELMKAYPALGDIKVQFKRMRAAYGAYHRDTNTIEVDLDTARTNPEMTAITLRHEIQHAIQRIEGVEGGASLYSWKEILDRNGSTEHPLNMYQRSVGEIEARAASKLEGPGMPTREQYANAVSMREYENRIHPQAAQFSVQQLAQANGMRFDEDTRELYGKDGKVIDGVKNKITIDMIEETPIGKLINLARDGSVTKGGKERFKSTISAETALAQKKMFTDLMNMIAQYKNSDLVWEIASSTLYSALKSNSDPQYSTTVDFGTICTKTQEIINVMSRVMLEKGRGLTREEVLKVYNETANAGLSVPCPVCYVFSRWMGVPSLLNQMSQYQKRFVVFEKDGKTIDKRETEKKANAYIREAMKHYGSKKELDAAKTQIMNRMKTQEKTKTDALLVISSRNATAEEKAAAQEKHDKAIKELDKLTKDLGEVEAYNWVTQALMIRKGNGEYELDKDFRVTPDEILFDLRRTGEFARDIKNWRYRNTRGAGMGKAIMPYSGMSIGDVIFGTERKSDIKNPFLHYKESTAANGIKNAIARARKQNLIGGQRLQSTSDFRPEWGLDYLMTFLELQAVGSKVQMYTKVAEAVDLLASMGADINLSIMGRGSGYHEATAAEIREATKDTKKGIDLRSRMQELTDENGETHTYVLDFSDITGMEYNTAKAMKNKHDNVQMILVGMNDTHIRLAMANKDIDFIIPWHSSGNSRNTLERMIASVGEKLTTSSDYTDTQTDKAREDQTEEQKRLWDLRVKIIQGKELTAEELKIVKGDKNHKADEYLSSLYDRFNVEGVDPDCYQVKLGKEQAEQIFPYEYWDKSLSKAEADGNGKRFVEYCRHFGITPRFENLSGYEGYWKLLIDRPMYDNNGNYRDQQVVDVTKARIGHLQGGKLKDSDMPLTTSAIYGSNYAEQEKTATDNSLAALDMQPDLQAVGTNVMEEEEDAPRNNMSTFGAARNTPTLKTTETAQAEEIAPARRRAVYADEESEMRRAMSVQDETDMNVNHFMLGLQEGSLQTEQERTMLRQYKELHGALEVSRFALADYRQKLAKIDAMTNPSAYDRAEALKLRNLISNYVAKVDRLQEKLAKVTSSEGYAGMMYRQSRIMDDLVNGRTADEVTRTVSALNDRLRKVEAEIAQRQMQIDYLKSNLAGKKLETLVDSKSLDQMARIIRKEYGSTYSKEDLMHDMTAIRLKMAQGQKVDADVEELTWKILQQTKNGGGEDLQALRGITITLGAKQVKELLGSNSSMKELRSIFAGTGVTIRTAKAGEQGLDTDWQQLCDMLPNLNRDAQELDQVDELIRFVQSQKESMNPNKRYKDQIQGIAEEIQAMIATVSMNAPADPAAMQILQKMSGLVDEMAGGLAAGKREMEAARKEIASLVDEGRLAIRGAEDLQKTIETAIQYNNALSKQSEAARWKHDKAALVAQLKDENTKALLKEQAKWKERIERDRQARESMATNMHLRHQINTNVVRIRKLLLNETDLKNIPEHMKSLAREMLGMILENDITGGRKITGIQRKDIIDTVKALEEMKKADGEFTLDDIRMIEDEEAQAVVEDSLADIEDGITLYNGKPGDSLLDNLDDYRKALESIANGVSNIVNVINAERYITQGDRQVLVADAAQDVYKGMENSRFRGEWRGLGSKAVNAVRGSVGYGNLTPVYFIKNLRNEGMTEQFNELQRGENRSGLEYKKAQDFVGAIAEKTHYRDWAGKKISVQIGSRQVEMTVDNALEILAIWNREQLATAEAPDKSNHMTRGGIFIQQEEDNKGAIRREKEQQRPMRLTESDIGGIREALTDEQKEYMDKVVGFLSNEMSQLGNEASMRMYGIKKYKEEYYFPMKIWDGVKSARSDKGIAGTDENRAAHRSWSKRRINRANNALVIGSFTEDAVNHIVEMINYNTMSPAIENLNKVLNFKLSEIAEDGEESKRNVRIAFQEAYGKDALKYLETFLADLNGGAVQDQRKTLRDRMLSVFKKNAVAGSLSVTLQQPLSYIRAAMMLNPMDLARALSPTYWKGSWAEMQKYSGVAVIKDMGRFDMNFGQSAKDFIAPETKGSAYKMISEMVTKAPELADRMTWTRMWSACKIEQHRLHPELDMTSDEFLQQVAERFNDMVRRTQVYDSVLVKSSNMRSQKFEMKLLTSFMAEPTLSLNVLADAVQNFKEKGGKTMAAKAAATFLISAALQAAVKGLMGSGRTPDDKKTKAENFLYKYLQAFMSEANPISLIPGYGDLVELLKTGELSDDAMGVLGKITTVGKTAMDVLNGKGRGAYRDLEDTIGQVAQLFTNIPAKNIMRDLRATVTWFSGSGYANRPTSGAVIRHQFEAQLANADNVIGVINKLLGDAGFKTTNSAYYQRMFDAMQGGNQAEADSIREYLTLGKGVEEKNIVSGLKDVAKKSMEAADADEWMIDQGMMNGTDTITKQLKAGEISFDEAGRLMKKADPKLTDNDVWWRLDRIRYQQEKKLDKALTGDDYYYRLTDAINANKAEEIKKAVKDLLDHGVTKERIIKKIGSWKSIYKTADTAAERRVIRDALQKTYKAMGLTAEDADKKIDSWYPESSKSKKKKN